MKRLKKLATLLLAAALMLAPLVSSSITANPEEPRTYYVKYVESYGEWRFQLGGWDDTKDTTHIYYLTDTIKNGDAVVVDGFRDNPFVANLNVRLSNLTYLHANANITALGVDECYVLMTSYAVTNADVEKAYVYDSSICNFNKNVKELYLLNAVHEVMTCSVGVLGTVDHAKATNVKNNVIFEYYNFHADKFRMDKGLLTTSPEFYSTTPTVTTTPSTSTGNTSAGEYDDVPKTGEWNPAWMLLGVAAACGIMSRKLRHS